MEMIVMLGLMIACLFMGYIIGLKKNSKPTTCDKWQLLHYVCYYDTSFGSKVLSCRFTVINATTQKVYSRICYGKCYSQGEVVEAMKHSVAHKLGEEDFV